LIGGVLQKLVDPRLFHRTNVDQRATGLDELLDGGKGSAGPGGLGMGWAYVHIHGKA
jgi:hypothetical protein